MKKIMTLALACAAMLGSTAIAQEVTYVEDPAQGYTFNKFKSNWFITAEGGVNMQFSKHDVQREWSDRFAPAFGLQVGKWFSPIMGFRGGATYLGAKGVAKNASAFGLVYGDNGAPEMYKDYYKTKVGNLGINFDALLNVTNWWCGYKPNRVYNFIAYVGGAAYFGFEHEVGSTSKWDKHFDTNIALRGGIINSFNVSKQVALSLDIRYTCLGARQESGYNYGALVNNAAAFLGVTYLFNQRTWTAPVVPVCPPVEDCDPIKRNLSQVQTNLQTVKDELEACKKQVRALGETSNGPAKNEARCEAPLVTVFFPIGSANITPLDKKVLNSAAAYMKENSGSAYNVCGWADTYTGSETINNNLRKKRAATVANYLKNQGVTATLNEIVTSGNRIENGNKATCHLDRCVTIEEAK